MSTTPDQTSAPSQPVAPQFATPQMPYPNQAPYGQVPGVHPFATASAAQSSAGKRFGSYLLEGVLVMITLGIGWFIWSLIVWGRGQTPAKAVMKMRVLNTETGRPATWGTMALRELIGKGLIGSISFGITTLVSCFMIMSEGRRGVWDKMANTIVVDDPNNIYG